MYDSMSSPVRSTSPWPRYGVARQPPAAGTLPERLAAVQ